MNHKKAFTLIELLVVIAIIGLLASIVVVNVNSARNKAKKARGLQFAQSIYSAMGLDAVGVWNFDEGSGNPVKDSSGNNNNGTWQGTGSHWSTTEKILGASAGQFNGSNDYVSVGAGNYLEFSNKNKITVEAWVYVTSESTNWVHFVGNGNSYWLDLQGASDEMVAFYVSNGPNNYAAGPVSMLNNAWHHVVGVADDSDKSLKLYLDGALAAQGSFSGATVAAGGNFAIGALPPPGNRYMGGYIDEVRVYSRTLTSAEIQKIC